MSRQWYVMLPAMAALLAGCAAEDRSATQPPRSTSTSTPSPTPQAVLTEACPLLSNDDLTRLLNNDRDANLTATEAPPEDDDGKIFKCLYGNGRATALELVVREFPANGSTAAAAIDAVGESSGTTPVPVTGVGEAAVFYPTEDGLGVVLAGAKMSGDNVRVAVLAGPAVLPRDKLTDVAALVMTRL